ncbi:hypothetical protein RB653_001027 [Dictyostelium firmibasis]|uniref:EGF-like domain-containing protein n=1 Tax=Dictyostelium firmibasis TaxID=79012 RepID=A0AAN7Z1R8_9MYCE
MSSQNTFSISKNAFWSTEDIEFSLTNSSPLTNYSLVEVFITYSNNKIPIKCSFDPPTREVICKKPTTAITQVISTITINDPSLKYPELLNITLINLSSSITQNGANLAIEGSLFDQLNINEIMVTNGSTSVEIIQVNSTKIIVSLANLPSYSVGTFTFYYGFILIATISIAPLSFSPFIVSASPLYINENDSVIISGVFFDSESKFFINSYLNASFSIPFELHDPSTALIKKETIKASTISGPAEIIYKSLAIGMSNAIPIYFTLPIISGVGYDFEKQVFLIHGNFLNEAGIYNYLDVNGCAITSYPLQPDFQNSTMLIFNNLKLVFDYCVLKCLQSNSTPYILNVYPELKVIDNSIPRKGGEIYFSGSFLTEYTLKGNKIYDIWVENLSQTLYAPCKNIKLIQYHGNQNYLMSCSIDKYFEYPIYLKLNGTGITESRLAISYQPIAIETISSTFYQTPDMVTITGYSFCPKPLITIGGSNCSNPVVKLSLNESYDQIVCDFKSDVQGINITHTVNITCETNTYSFDAFLYKLKVPCPSGGSLNKECYGNGQCDDNLRTCTCNKGYAGFDCSIVQPKPSIPPIPKVNDTITIIETSGTKFDIGIVQIREVTYDNNIEKTFNLTNLKWNLQDQNSDFQFIYNTSLNTNSKDTNNKSTIIKVQISINNNSVESQQYDFLGDIITILPNSVKYQVEIQNWSFNNNLNSIQLIVLSQSNPKSNCDENSGTTNILKYGEDSIRTLELTLSNGQTLVGTFSNRMKIDDRVLRSKVEILEKDQLNGIPLVNRDSNSIVSVIRINNFKKNVIIDPSFGLIISDDINKNDSCNEFPKWKIAVIVVCGAVGLSILFIGSFFLYKKFKTSLIILEIRLKLKK